jgi:hypothetical protein
MEGESDMQSATQSTVGNVERDRSAAACLALASEAQLQAESLGPLNDHSAVFAEWALRLRAQASRLRPA